MFAGAASPSSPGKSAESNSRVSGDKGRQSVDQGSPIGQQLTPLSARSTDSSIASTVVPRARGSDSLPQTPISLGGSTPLRVGLSFDCNLEGQTDWEAMKEGLGSGVSACTAAICN